MGENGHTAPGRTSHTGTAVLYGETRLNAAPQKAEALVVRNLNKRYGNGIWANRDISLTAKAGEVLGILGPNGAGKTTLVRQITTELLLTSGDIHIFGGDVVADPLAAKALLGIVPQETTPFEYLSVRQHLTIFGRLRGLSAKNAERRTQELVADLDLVQHLNVPVENLSGGLRRRVLLGIAALARPPIMVLDEPSTGLDPRSRRDLWSAIRRYQDQRTTVLITSHYMEEAEALCDRVGIIQDGRLLALDTVANLRTDHGYEFKITYTCNGSMAEAQTLYGTDDTELVERVRAMGAHQYSVARTNLEDVYLALTGEKDVSDGDSS